MASLTQKIFSILGVPAIALGVSCSKPEDDGRCKSYSELNPGITACKVLVAKRESVAEINSYEVVYRTLLGDVVSGEIPRDITITIDKLTGCVYEIHRDYSDGYLEFELHSVSAKCSPEQTENIKKNLPDYFIDSREAAFGR